MFNEASEVAPVARGKQVRIDGKLRTIPAERVPQYEAFEAAALELFDDDNDCRAALRAAALYLLEVPAAPSDDDRSLARVNGIETVPNVEAWTHAAGEFMARFGAERSAAIAAARAIAVVSDAPEGLIASSLGVNRSTVRRWRGKDERK